MQTLDPTDVVRAVAGGVSRLVAGRLDPAERERQLDALADLYAEQTDVRHPFLPTGDRPMTSRSELRDHFAHSGQRTSGVERFEPTGMHVHRTADPEVVVAEFRYTGSAGGRPFELPCIFVVRVRDGRIVESRDYGDHVGMARAFGRLDGLLQALAADREPADRRP